MRKTIAVWSGVLTFVCGLVSADYGQAQGTFSAHAAARMGFGSSAKKPDDAAVLKWAAAGRIDPKAKEAVALDTRGRYVFRTKADKAAEIKRLRDKQAAAGLPPISILNPKEGQVGTLTSERTTYHVTQILGRNSAMIRAVTNHAQYSSTGRFGPAKVAGEWSFFLDAPTKDFHEDQTLDEIPGVWRVGAKRKYETVLGAERMLHVVTPADIVQDQAAAGKRATFISPTQKPPLR